MTIFVQIASYRDPQLIPTIDDMLDNAKYPENLRIGICHQYHPDDKFSNLTKYRLDDRFRITDVLYSDSRGACWVRNQIQQVYSGETYTLQIDSHMRFEENFDFIKINYTEFYGDNGTAWPWYNLPQDKRKEYFPEKPNLPVQGLDPNAPKTKFNNIKSLQGLPYVDGEIYYCNWTQLVSKSGNKKMFIETTWERPFENTWMSHMYQLTKKGKIKPGLLLLTPIEHDRFEHYSGELRKEC